MAKTKAPLFGFGASGKLGDAIVFGSWKGIDVAREYVVPANPQSAEQTTQRGYFTDGVTSWHDMLDQVSAVAADGEAWNRYAGVLGRMSGFNAFMREYVNERVAGGTPYGEFFGFAVTDPSAASMDLTVELSGASGKVVTARWGNSKTWLPYSDSSATVGGVYTMAAEDSNFSAGTRIYMYFEAGAVGVDYARSGLYSFILT
jgi:hypothetical protein